MKRSLFLIIGLAGLLLGLVLPYNIANAAGPPTGGIGLAQGPVKHYAPCTNEDGPGECVWDAKTRGNGQGTSFRLTATQQQFNLSDTYCTAAQLNSGYGPCRVVTDQSGGYNVRWLTASGLNVLTP